MRVGWGGGGGGGGVGTFFFFACPAGFSSLFDFLTQNKAEGAGLSPGSSPKSAIAC